MHRFGETDQMDRVEFNPTDLILRAVRSTASRRIDTGTTLPVAVLRDARKSALLRTRLMDDVDMIRTMETLD